MNTHRWKESWHSRVCDGKRFWSIRQLLDAAEDEDAADRAQRERWGEGFNLTSAQNLRVMAFQIAMLSLLGKQSPEIG